MTAAGELRVRIGAVPATLRGEGSRLVLQFAGALDAIRAISALRTIGRQRSMMRAIGLTPIVRVGRLDFEGLLPRLAR